jgi:hypothetical protein
MITPPLDTIDKIRKLLALALSNPNENEAKAAALKAAEMIRDNNITLGGITVTQPVKNWTAPDVEFDDIVSAVEHANDPTSGKTGIKPSIPDTDIDDDFMRKRIKLAWQAIRNERERLKREIGDWERRHRERYPRPEPKDWE